jgi:hypothetical protein
MDWKHPLRSISEKLREQKAPPAASAPAVEDEKDPEQIAKKLNELFSEQLRLSGDVDSLINNIHLHLDYCGGQYRRVGLYHGTAGTRDFHIRSITDAHATLITDRVISVLSAQSESHAFINEEKKKDLALAQGKQKKISQSARQIEERSVEDGKQFNLFNAYIYLFSGLAMILADIAVSVNLVAFFGVGHPKDNSNFLQKLGDMELLFFSLGIALCTVFIKIVYDEYINNKLGQTQLEFLELQNQETAINGKRLRWEYGIKLAVKFLILAGLLFLLYYLARYRTYFTIDKEFKQFAHMGKNQDISQLPAVMLKSFIGITLIIPVISGIALSGALKIFANRASRRRVRKLEKTVDKQIDALEQELQALIFKQKQIEKYQQEWGEKSVKVSLVSDFFAYYYDQGFRQGYRVAHGNDLYKLVEEYRNEIINQAFTRKLKSQS